MGILPEVLGARRDGFGANVRIGRALEDLHGLGLSERPPAFGTGKAFERGETTRTMAWVESRHCRVRRVAL